MGEDIKGIIRTLEKKLTDPEVRGNPMAISEILDDGFLEFCASGREYRYVNGDTFDDIDGRVYEIVDDLRIKRMTEDTLISTYTSKMVINGKISYAKRSSVWQKKDGEWKLVFHQGTPVDEKYVKV